jgi:hypothetical protein
MNIYRKEKKESNCLPNHTVMKNENSEQEHKKNIHIAKVKECLSDDS